MWGRCSELKATYYKRHKARGTWLSLGCGDASGPRLVALLRRPSEGEDSGNWKGGSTMPSIQKTGSGRSSVKGHL